MSISSALEQAMVARDTVMELYEQRDGRVREVGADGWMKELTDEAIGYLVKVGVSEEEAKSDLAMDLEEEGDPQRFLETLIAEARTVTKLGKMDEVAAKMKQESEEEKGK